MTIDERLLMQRLQELLQLLATAGRHPTLGYQGAAELEDLRVYAVFRGANGLPYIADPSELVDGHPDIALREWITVRGTGAGGRETVQPGGGGLPLGELLKIIGK